MADNAGNPKDRETLTPEKAVDVEITSSENDPADKRRKMVAENRTKGQTIDMDPGQPCATSTQRLDIEIPIADDMSIDAETSVSRRKLVKRNSFGELITKQTSKSSLSSFDEPLAPRPDEPVAPSFDATDVPISPKKEETPGSGEAAAKESAKTSEKKYSSVGRTIGPSDSEVYKPSSPAKEVFPSSSKMVDSRPQKLKECKCPHCGFIDSCADLDKGSTASLSSMSLGRAFELVCGNCCGRTWLDSIDESFGPELFDSELSDSLIACPEAPIFRRSTQDTLAEVPCIPSSELASGCSEMIDKSPKIPSVLPVNKDLSNPSSSSKDKSSEAPSRLSLSTRSLFADSPRECPSTPSKQKILLSSDKTSPKAKISRPLPFRFRRRKKPVLGAPAKESRKSIGDSVMPVVQTSLASLGLQTVGIREFAEVQSSPSQSDPPFRPDPTPSPLPSGQQMAVDESAYGSGRENLTAGSPTEKADEARDCKMGFDVDDSTSEKRKPEEGNGST